MFAAFCLFKLLQSPHMEAKLSVYIDFVKENIRTCNFYVRLNLCQLWWRCDWVSLRGAFEAGRFVVSSCSTVIRPWQRDLPLLRFFLIIFNAFSPPTLPRTELMSGVLPRDAPQALGGAPDVISRIVNRCIFFVLFFFISPRSLPLFTSCTITSHFKVSLETGRFAISFYLEIK